MVTRGCYNKFQIEVINETTGLPISTDLVNDLNLHLFSESAKDIALYGNGNIAIENPSPGIFIVEIDPETSKQLIEGDTAFLEGITLPYKLDISLDLGMVKNNRAVDDPS